jgi:hypothetical protein
MLLPTNSRDVVLSPDRDCSQSRTSRVVREHTSPCCCGCTCLKVFLSARDYVTRFLGSTRST